MTPEQIDAYCKRLAEAWKRSGSLYLSDLLLSCATNGAGSCGHYWFEDDKEMITAIERMVENGKRQ
jgi:hypothetical protein